MIEQNYNQIWHGIKANIKRSSKSQLYKILQNFIFPKF